MKDKTNPPYTVENSTAENDLINTTEDEIKSFIDFNKGNNEAQMLMLLINNLKYGSIPGAVKYYANKLILCPGFFSLKPIETDASGLATKEPAAHCIIRQKGEINSKKLRLILEYSRPFNTTAALKLPENKRIKLSNKIQSQLKNN